MYKNVGSLERPKTITLATASGKAPVARLSPSHRGVALAGAVIGTQAVVNKHTQKALTADRIARTRAELQANRWSTAFGTRPWCRQSSESRMPRARHSQVPFGKQFSPARLLCHAFEFTVARDCLTLCPSAVVLVPVWKICGSSTGSTSERILNSSTDVNRFAEVALRYCQITRASLIVFNTAVAR
jgi:hypothetical protein